MKRKQGRVVRVGDLFDEVLKDFKQEHEQRFGFRPSNREATDTIGRFFRREFARDNNRRGGGIF